MFLTCDTLFLCPKKHDAQVLSYPKLSSWLAAPYSDPDGRSDWTTAASPSPSFGHCLMLIPITGKIASGKTTLCETITSLLPESFNHIAAGKLMRKHIRRASPLGIRIKGLLDENKGTSFLPRDIVPSIIMEAIYENPSLISPKILLLDGFPACRRDWGVFLNLRDCQSTGKNLYPFLHLQLHTTEEQRKRQFHRRSHTTSRSDDSLTSYHNRSALARMEQPLLDQTLVQDGLMPALIPPSVTTLTDRVKFTLAIILHHLELLQTKEQEDPPQKALTFLTGDILLGLQRISSLTSLSRL